MCLDSLCRQTFPVFEVVVCVDGSTDGTLEWLYESRKSFPFNCHVLTHPQNENRGRQATRNLALKQFDFSYWLFLDSDLLVESHWVQEHCLTLEKSEISIGKVYFTNSDNAWADYYNSRGFNDSSLSGFQSTRYFISGNAAIRKEVFEKVGFFDETIRAYGGDAEFALRLLSTEIKRLYFTSNAVAKGELHKSVLESLEQYKTFFSGLLSDLMKKYPGNETYFNYGLIRRLTPFVTVMDLNLEYAADCIDHLKWQHKISRFLIRALMTLGAAQSLKK